MTWGLSAWLSRGCGLFGGDEVLTEVTVSAPLMLFPVAQQYVDSSVAGMINGATL